MRRAKQISLRRWLLLALLVGAAGCLGGPAPRDHVYRLHVDPPGDARNAPVFPGILEVARIDGNPLTRGRPILRSDSDRSVEVTPYGYHVWIDSPTLLLQRELAAYLRQAGLAESVVTPERATSADWVVTGFLGRLDHIAGGDAPHVLVELELRLIEARRSRLLLRETYRAEQHTDGTGVPAAVRAFGTAVDAIFESFAADAAAAR